MIATKFCGTFQSSSLQACRMIFGTIDSQEFLSDAVIAVRCEVGGKILIPLFFVEQVLLDDAVFIGRAGTIQTHLKILVVYHNVMERKFHVSK